MLFSFHMPVIFPVILSMALIRSCYKEVIAEEPEPWSISNQVIELDHVFAFCDIEDRILLYPLPADTIREFSPFVRFGDYQFIEIDGVKLIDNTVNNLGEVRIDHPYQLTARNGSQQDNYRLIFTLLPLLHIHTDRKIKDAPKILSWAELAYSNMQAGQRETHLFTSYAGIEIRGRTSAAYEKKSYGIELWENWCGGDRSAPLLGMREGEDWILDAMYVDQLRMRNKLSFEIWGKMWDKQNAYPFKTSNPGILGEYVELFINQRYMGLYCLTERLDEALVNLDSAPEGTGAVLYKAIYRTGGTTDLTSYISKPGNSMIWDGWEQIYPDDLCCWDPLDQLIKSVIYDSDEVFKERIDTLINLEAAAVYYLFTNLILAYDNISKNYFLARYAGDTQFLILPWDLEGSWGIMWDGDHSLSTGLLENGLYKRLMELDVENFNEMLENKWKHYRESIFKEDSLTTSFVRTAKLLQSSGALERENKRWPGVEIDMEGELAYYLQWTRLRLNYLDQVFN